MVRVTTTRVRLDALSMAVKPRGEFCMYTPYRVQFVALPSGAAAAAVAEGQDEKDEIERRQGAWGVL